MGEQSLLKYLDKSKNNLDADYDDEDGVTSKYPLLLTQGKAPMERRAKRRRRRAPEGSALMMMMIMTMVMMMMTIVMMMMIMYHRIEHKLGATSLLMKASHADQCF